MMTVSSDVIMNMLARPGNALDFIKVLAELATRYLQQINLNFSDTCFRKISFPVFDDNGISGKFDLMEMVVDHFCSIIAPQTFANPALPFGCGTCFHWCAK